jgi:hypothetical protein
MMLREFFRASLPWRETKSTLVHLQHEDFLHEDRLPLSKEKKCMESVNWRPAFLPNYHFGACCENDVEAMYCLPDRRTSRFGSMMGYLIKQIVRKEI